MYGVSVRRLSRSSGLYTVSTTVASVAHNAKRKIPHGRGKGQGRPFDLVSYTPAVAAQRRSLRKEKSMHRKASKLLKQSVEGMLTSDAPDRGIKVNSMLAAIGSRRVAKRLGRGRGSGKGKTSARGIKGQKARAGYKHKRGFEGGQTPVQLRFPKRGFSRAALQKPWNVVNLGKLHSWIKRGKLNGKEVITLKHMVDARLVSKGVKYGVKLLAKGGDGIEFDYPIRIEVSDVGERAKQIIEKSGGQVLLKYFNRVNLRAHLKPHKFEGPLPRHAAPPLKWLAKHKDSLAEVYHDMPKVQDMLKVIGELEHLRSNRIQLEEAAKERIEAARYVLQETEINKHKYEKRLHKEATYRKPRPKTEEVLDKLKSKPFMKAARKRSKALAFN